MAKKKSNIDDIIDSKQAPGQMGSKKKYFVDHKTVWDGSLGSIDRKTRKRTGGVLVTAEGVSGGRRVIETSDSELQGKLEKRGYVADAETKLMHDGRTGTVAHPQPGCPTVKSPKQVNKDNSE